MYRNSANEILEVAMKNRDKLLKYIIDLLKK